MKTLLLIRHAKSSWDFDVDDFDRQLNHRGQRDAPAMAERLKNKDVKIDSFVSSPAKRAMSTAAFFAGVYGLRAKDIILIPELYEPTAEAFEKVITALDDNHNIVALFSHNPGITDFANALTTFKTDDMPTCAVFAVNSVADSWADFLQEVKTLSFFDYPKSE